VDGTPVLHTYDAENRLIAIAPQNPADGDTRVEYTYDYMSRRVEKTVFTRSAGQWILVKEIRFVYDGWNLIKETIEESGQPPADKFYVWGLDLSQSLQGSGGVGGLLALVDADADKAYRYLYDANGNVGQLIDTDSGAIAAHYEYDPYGNEIRASGPLADANRFRFSTKYYETEYKLYYYGYRFYAADLGRWLSPDPLGEAGGVNLYAFAANDAVNRIDILGLSCSFGSVSEAALKGAVVGYIKTMAAKKLVTAGVKIVASQVVPVVGQVAGGLMTAWEVYSFGRTVYMVYTDADRIKETLQAFYPYNAT
jgi:RHS repeat-associated protein